VRIYPAQFVYGVRLKHLILTFLFLGSFGRLESDVAAPGFLEGQLKILAFRDVDLAEETRSKFRAGNFSDYPLIIFTGDGNTEVKCVTADGNGHYRATLPPGDYVLDVQNRVRRHLRVRPKPFRVLSGQTIRVDITIDAGIR